MFFFLFFTDYFLSIVDCLIFVVFHSIVDVDAVARAKKVVNKRLSVDEPSSSAHSLSGDSSPKGRPSLVKLSSSPTRLGSLPRPLSKTFDDDSSATESADKIDGGSDDGGSDSEYDSTEELESEDDVQLLKRVSAEVAKSPPRPKRSVSSPAHRHHQWVRATVPPEDSDDDEDSSELNL